MNSECEKAYKLYFKKKKIGESTLLKSLDCESLNFDLSNNVTLPFSIEFRETGSYINDFINSNGSKVIDYETIISDNPENEYKVLNSKEKWIWKKYHYKKIDNKYKRFIKHSKECYIEYECIKILD